MVRHCNDPKKTGTGQGLLHGRITGKLLCANARGQQHGLDVGPKQIQPSLSVEDDRNGGIRVPANSSATFCEARMRRKAQGLLHRRA
jgi:hypothetical protein